MEKNKTNIFIEKAIKVHGNKYSYDKVNYTKANIKVIITCNYHGDFEQIPNNHLRGSGCSKCYFIKQTKTRIKSTELFIQDACKIHGNLYNYSNTVYGKNNKDYLNITCNIHGKFKQKPIAHLNGQGCPECGKSFYWGRSNYIKKAKNKLCTFYIIRCFNKEEEFFKIGITMNSVKKRYISKKDMPYMYQIILEVFGEAGEIWDLELQEKRKLKKYNYQPKIKFGGSKTECFTQYKIKIHDS